jgi:sec-independent protein translocase protein TatA
MFGSFNFWEILIILVIVLVLFGGKKIPQLAKDLGTGIREFKDSLTNPQPGTRDESRSQSALEDRREEDPPARRPAQAPRKKASRKA